VLPSNTQVSVAAVTGHGVSRGQLEQMTSEPVVEPEAAGLSGQIPHQEAIAGATTPGSGLAVIGQIAQAMAGLATTGPGLASTGQTGQAIMAVAQEIGQAIVDCATGGTGQARVPQPPSSGHAVCGGEIPAVADGSATGDPHGPPPTPMQTPAPLPVAPEALPLATPALATGGVAAEAPPEL